MKWFLAILAVLSFLLGFALLISGDMGGYSGLMYLLFSVVLLCGTGIVDAIEVHATKMEQLLKNSARTRDDVKDE